MTNVIDRGATPSMTAGNSKLARDWTPPPAALPTDAWSGRRLWADDAHTGFTARLPPLTRPAASWGSTTCVNGDSREGSPAAGLHSQPLGELAEAERPTPFAADRFA